MRWSDSLLNSGTYISKYTVMVHDQVWELCKQILLTYLVFTADLITVMDECALQTFLEGCRFSVFLFGTIHMHYCIMAFENLSQNLMKGRKCFHSAHLM